MEGPIGRNGMKPQKKDSWTYLHTTIALAGFFILSTALRSDDWFQLLLPSCGRTRRGDGLFGDGQSMLLGRERSTFVFDPWYAF